MSLDTFSLELPKGILRASKLTPDELKVELAVSLFAQRKLSLGKAAEVAGMTRWRFQQLVASRRIPLHYDVTDFERDLETLARLGGR